MKIGKKRLVTAKNNAVVLFIELCNEMKNALNYMIPVVISEIVRFLFGCLLIPPCHRPCVISDLAKIIVKLLSNV